jgi:signal transduction histidine kinase
MIEQTLIDEFLTEQTLVERSLTERSVNKQAMNEINESPSAPLANQRPLKNGNADLAHLRMENAELKKQLAQLSVDLNQARMEALQAMELKAQFMSNISHELRTPMSGVLGMAELLKDMPLTEEQQELVSYIYTSANDLVEVVNGLLDFSRLQAGRLNLERHEFCLEAILDSIRNIYEDTASNKGLSLVIKKPKHTPELLVGDGVRIKQVLAGLVNNAIKFSERGTVLITLSIEDKREEVVFLRFSVKDDGIGIAKEDQESIFTPFFQLDGSNTRRYGGVGLGLPICKRLVKLMSGSIGLRSKVNQGSTFWFSVPVEVKN